ncbi:hypothetical protein BD413DRAFT_144422 [Trametes elegans]|nr:hypothetical protein BD413DRAFT_144422 [Trametes elegans]
MTAKALEELVSPSWKQRPWQRRFKTYLASRLPSRSPPVGSEQRWPKPPMRLFQPARPTVQRFAALHSPSIVHLVLPSSLQHGLELAEGGESRVRYGVAQPQRWFDGGAGLRHWHDACCRDRSWSQLGKVNISANVADDSVRIARQTRKSTSSLVRNVISAWGLSKRGGAVCGCTAPGGSTGLPQRVLSETGDNLSFIHSPRIPGI